MMATSLPYAKNEGKLARKKKTATEKELEFYYLLQIEF